MGLRRTPSTLVVIFDFREEVFYLRAKYVGTVVQLELRMRHIANEYIGENQIENKAVETEEPKGDILETGNDNKVEDLGDLASVVFFCASDATMMLSLEGVRPEYFIPTIKVQPGDSILQQISQGILQNILVTPEQKKRIATTMGKYRGKIRWTNETELRQFLASNNLKSPELLDYYYKCDRNVNHTINLPSEYSISGNIFEVSDSVISLGRNTIFEQLVNTAGFSADTQDRLYNEFLLMCSPAHFLNIQVFSDLLISTGWSRDDVPHLFRSADVFARGGLSFREFVYFLAAVEPGVSFAGGPAELRCRYIFRYLDTNNCNVLKYGEMKRYFTLLSKQKKQSQTKIEEELPKFYKAMNFTEDHGITMPEFLTACGNLVLRGISQIFRATQSMNKWINSLSEQAAGRKSVTILNPRGNRPGSFKTLPPVIVKAKYELGMHLVKIQNKGTVIRVEELLNNLVAASASVLNRSSSRSDLSRVQSKNQFDQNSPTNELLRAVRYLVQVNKKDNVYIKVEEINYSWGTQNFLKVASQVVSVCENIKKLFLSEPRMLEVHSPAYIMGDLHGNVLDLLNFERVLWTMGPGLCPANLIFLGDFVDRGVFSFEVICYLFCYKIQNPTKVFLIRGNHEIRQIQRLFTFEKECKLKFGEKMGNIVFNAINDAFDTMPLALVIDNLIFCCHGGIPPPWICPVISAINDIPSVLSNPQEESPLAWELMWNDPLRGAPENAKLNMELIANEGFAVNYRRGTAHLFNYTALERFLNVNKLTHLIRAHEVEDAGFNVLQNAKLVSVFSTSHYCGKQNEAACILTDHNKLRILKLESES